MRPWWGIVMMLLLAACTSHKNGDAVETRRATSLPTDVSPELSAIDSLMWQRPDSALMCLLPYFDTCCRDGVHTVSTTNDCHYANLLLAELLYKNDNPQLNRAELLQAVDYYDSLHACTDVARNVSTNAFLDARAHYINGVGYYERDSVVEACQEYLKALEVMEERFEKKDLTGNKAMFMALTYTRLTVLFSDLYLHEQAIYFGKNSLLFYDKHSSSPRRIAWMLNEIGAQYEMIEVLDSANQYYFEGIELLSDTNTITYRDLKTHIVFLSYEKGENPSFSLMQTRILLNQAATRKEYLSRCLTIGEIFYHENEYDSAYVYLKKVFSETPKTSPKKQAAEWLVETCKRLEKDEEILEYASFLTTFANQDENQSATKSHLTELCNVYRQNVLERRHQQIIQKNTVRNIVIIIGLLNVMLVIILLYHRNKKKLEHYENDTLYENEPSSKSWDKLAEFLGEPICQEIVRSIQNENIKRMATPKDYPHHILSNAQLQQLTLTVNRYFGSFENYLGQRANPSLVNLCHLYLLGIDEKRASILLNKDYSSIKRYEKKLKTIFQTQENMTSYLRNLMINN